MRLSDGNCKTDLETREAPPSVQNAQPPMASFEDNFHFSMEHGLLYVGGWAWAE